ncbi:50S ribosomal protein L3 N(5)-glutamine methyltransferase [Neomegalonema perideroedes]|uniref:50S ribosomal protein L3 N(5)-glutamine methyltransferase n=1 Tax=Neomegalonema perideroedes TaxID=217219 RepID=UPI00037BA173|nr:50S ribosomal protein L3 N(5)-glutamine methyltransferase [Neomegalonema perideroedes]
MTRPIPYAPLLVSAETAVSETRSLRDLLRWAVGRFNAAGIFHGHGVDTAWDEAVFLMLEALALPVDQLEPYLDARLTEAERRRLAELVEARIETRKPSVYLVNKTYLQGLPFYVDERVIVPRSYISEILFSGVEGLWPDPSEVASVLDLCAGSACLAILAAQVFPLAEIHAVELSPEAAEVARINIADHGLEDRVTLHVGDLFAPLEGLRFDLILTNPPYVDAEGMGWLTPEHRHEPEMALAAGEDGMSVARRILAEGRDHLTPRGGMLAEVGRLRPAVEAEAPDLPLLWIDTEQSRGETFWISAEAWSAASSAESERKAAGAGKPRPARKPPKS